jgi:hypothetical protein
MTGIQFKHLAGIYYSGISVFGIEYYYCSEGVKTCQPVRNSQKFNFNLFMIRKIYFTEKSGLWVSFNLFKVWRSKYMSPWHLKWHILHLSIRVKINLTTHRIWPLHIFQGISMQAMCWDQLQRKKSFLRLGWMASSTANLSKLTF